MRRLSVPAGFLACFGRRSAFATLVGALLLSGCAEKPRVLRICNWFEYVSPEVITAFERAIIGGIVRDVDDFANGAEQADDITLLAFKLVGKVS